MPPPHPTPGPYDLHWHPVAWAVLAAGVAAVWIAHRRGARRSPSVSARWTSREKAAFWCGVAAAAVAFTWPLADLAAHWSLCALVLQRLIAVLVVAPLLLAGIPEDVMRRWTRPRAVDWCLDRAKRAGVAVAGFAVLAVGLMSVGAVDLQASNAWARGTMDAAVLAAGVLLWMPVVLRTPGPPRVGPIGRFAYLATQSVLPAFVSFVYIFARHPIYGFTAGSHRAIGVSPLTDQMLAGFLTKLGMLVPLLIVAGVMLSRARADERTLGEGDPLAWGDVEREFERIDRRARRTGDAPGGELP